MSRMHFRWWGVVGMMAVVAGPVFAEAKPPAATKPAAGAAADSQGEALVPKTVAVDTNKDGRPDRWEYYEGGTTVARIEADTNFDGTVDEWIRFERGKVVKVEDDTDHDGKPDRWVDY
ncbi:MAG: hypothetical protein HY600_01120 [Candidatus Omnitrophica bacterium]|nr:hypothetical protein [Candidatus Omnitrophota bacterium]